MLWWRVRLYKSWWREHVLISPSGSQLWPEPEWSYLHPEDRDRQARSSYCPSPDYNYRLPPAPPRRCSHCPGDGLNLILATELTGRCLQAPANSWHVMLHHHRMCFAALLCLVGKGCFMITWLYLISLKTKIELNRHWQIFFLRFTNLSLTYVYANLIGGHSLRKLILCITDIHNTTGSSVVFKRLIASLADRWVSEFIRDIPLFAWLFKSYLK